MSGCIFCNSQATVKIHNVGSTIRYQVCDPCYRSRMDSLVVIERKTDEDPPPSTE